MAIQGSSETETVRAHQQGANIEWDDFFARHDPLIRSIVAWPKWHLDRETQQDLAQAIRLEIMKAMPHFQGGSTLDYFIKRICVHRCIDEIRRQVKKRSVFVSLFPTDPDSTLDPLESPAGEEFDPVREVELSERASLLKSLLGQLDQTCGQAIRYFYVDAMKYREIADKLGIAVNTVGSRLSKCLEKLRNLGEKSVYSKEDI
jgi:RNA polymerase sigma factor (sigma-70 family)